MPPYFLAPNNNVPVLMSSAPVFEVSAPILPVQAVPIKVEQPKPEAVKLQETKPEVNLSKQDLIKLLLTQLAKADIEA